MSIMRVINLTLKSPYSRNIGIGGKKFVQVDYSGIIFYVLPGGVHVALTEMANGSCTGPCPSSDQRLSMSVFRLIPCCRWGAFTASILRHGRSSQPHSGVRGSLQMEQLFRGAEQARARPDRNGAQAMRPSFY